MTALLVLVPLVVCLALVGRGRYPGEHRLSRALERAVRWMRRARLRTPLRDMGFGVPVRGTGRGRAPPFCLL